MNEPNNSPASVTGHHRLPPVRVKIFREDGKVAPVHPPDGEAKLWWERLNKALGTTSSDFVNASLFQIQSASRSPWGGISELSMNAALAMIEAAAPKDEIEAALAVQMACTHTAAWQFSPSWKVPSHRAASCRLRVSDGSLDEGFFNSSRGISTVAWRRPAICSRRACPCERWRAGGHR
jgi:hypothetical protein